MVLIPYPTLAAEERVLALLQPVADGVVRGDLTAGLDIMYGPAVRDSGGREELRAAVELVQEILAEQRMKTTRFELVRPFRFVRGTKRQYVIVQTVTEMKTPRGTMRTQGFQFGVEIARGKWRFLDGARTTPEALARYFPDFPRKEKLPVRKDRLVRKR